MHFFLLVSFVRSFIHSFILFYSVLSGSFCSIFPYQQLLFERLRLIIHNLKFIFWLCNIMTKIICYKNYRACTSTIKSYENWQRRKKERRHQVQRDTLLRMKECAFMRWNWILYYYSYFFAALHICIGFRHCYWHCRCRCRYRCRCFRWRRHNCEIPFENCNAIPFSVNKKNEEIKRKQKSDSKR